VSAKAGSVGGGCCHFANHGCPEENAAQRQVLNSAPFTPFMTLIRMAILPVLTKTPLDPKLLDMSGRYRDRESINPHYGRVSA